MRPRSMMRPVPLLAVLLLATIIATLLAVPSMPSSTSAQDLIEVTVDAVDQQDQHLDGATIYIDDVVGSPLVPYVITIANGGDVGYTVGWGGTQSYAVVPVLKDNTYWIDALTNQTIKTESTPGVNKVNVVFEPIQVTVDAVDQEDQHLEGANIYVGPGQEPVPYSFTMANGGSMGFTVIWGGLNSFAHLNSQTILKDNTYWVDALTNQTIRTESTPGVNKVNVVFERPSLTFSYTFDDAAPDDPDVLPAADDCRVGVPCKSLWNLEVPEGQPLAPVWGVVPPSAVLQGAGPALVPDGAIIGKVSGSWRQGPPGECATEGTIVPWEFFWLKATTNESTTTGSIADLCSFAQWPTQLNGFRDAFLAAHPGAVLSRRRFGCPSGYGVNELYFVEPDGSILYTVSGPDLAVSPPPAAVEGCSPELIRSIDLGVSLDNPDTPVDEGGIPLQTCIAPGTHTMTVDRGAIVLEDTATCSPNTPAGSGVPVPLNGGTGAVSGIDLTFSQVSSPGSTSVVTTTAGPPPPTGFKIVGLSEIPLYFDINTDASYSGDLTVCIRYDETQVAGPEANLRLMQRVDGFADITTSVDTVNDVICGTTTHLSIFVVAEPVVSPTPTPHPEAHGVGGAVLLPPSAVDAESGGTSGGSGPAVATWIVLAGVAGALGFSGVYVRSRRRSG